jgi:ElaB/YqjD/DUF883 family membrane-anchored ribosome-binding protein
MRASLFRKNAELLPFQDILSSWRATRRIRAQKAAGFPGMHRFSYRRPILINIQSRRRDTMSETVVNRAGERIAETARTASRMTSAMADAVEEGMGAARRVAKQAGDAAEEFFDDTTKRLERHPIETVVGSVALGIAIGIVIGWLISRE